ncbi:MAG: response regulator [Candidatus Paceibacterota bacterium]|jgi:DNA-binding response OmpR family regulator
MPDTGNKKVLLVEDEQMLREICSMKLTKEGFNVVVALDGEEALKKVEEEMPDIVLLDIILPNIDGFGVLEKIRAHTNERVAKVPVIMLTNLGQDEDVAKARTLGANDYLVKAYFNPDEISSKVKALLHID